MYAIFNPKRESEGAAGNLSHFQRRAVPQTEGCAQQGGQCALQRPAIIAERHLDFLVLFDVCPVSQGGLAVSAVMQKELDTKLT